MKPMVWVLYYLLANDAFSAVPVKSEEACEAMKADLEMTMASIGNPVIAAVCSYDEAALFGEVDT